MHEFQQELPRVLELARQACRDKHIRTDSNRPKLNQRPTERTNVTLDQNKGSGIPIMDEKWRSLPVATRGLKEESPVLEPLTPDSSLLEQMRAATKLCEYLEQSSRRIAEMTEEINSMIHHLKMVCPRKDTVRLPEMVKGRSELGLDHEILKSTLLVSKESESLFKSLFNLRFCTTDLNSSIEFWWSAVPDFPVKTPNSKNRLKLGIELLSRSLHNPTAHPWTEAPNIHKKFGKTQGNLNFSKQDKVKAVSIPRELPGPGSRQQQQPYRQTRRLKPSQRMEQLLAGSRVFLAKRVDRPQQQDTTKLAEETETYTTAEFSSMSEDINRRVTR